MIKTQCHLDCQPVFLLDPLEAENCLEAGAMPWWDLLAIHGERGNPSSKPSSKMTLQLEKWSECNSVFTVANPSDLPQPLGTVVCMYIWLHGRLISWNIKLHNFVSSTESIFSLPDELQDHETMEEEETHNVWAVWLMLWSNLGLTPFFSW